MKFVARTRLTGTTMVITIPAQVELEVGKPYQFGVEEIKKEVVDDGERD